MRREGKLVAVLREADIAYGLTGPLAEVVRRSPGLTLQPTPFLGIHWLVFADQWDPSSPWHDRRVRLAATYAVDRQAVNQAETLGFSKITGSIAVLLVGRPTRDPPLGRRPHSRDAPGGRTRPGAARRTASDVCSRGEQKVNKNLKRKGRLAGGARRPARATGGSVAHLSSREALQMIHKGRAVVATLVAAAPDHVRWKGYSPVSITKSMLPGRVVVLHICG